MDTMTEYLLTGAKYLMILLSVIILIRCLRSMFSVRYDPEVWGYMRVGNERIPVNHWENLIGRSCSADIRVDREGVSRVHAVLTRSDHGVWTIYDIFSKGGVWVNGERADDNGLTVEDGDAINLAGNVMRFYDTTPEKRQKLEEKREAAGLAVSPALTLFDLTLFELLLLAQYVYSAAKENLFPIALAFGTLILLQLCCYNAMRLMGRSGFEVETLAFYLTALGLAVAASSTPEDMYKQILLILVSVLLFLFGGWWLRSLKRSAVMRTPVAVLALALMALNVLTSESVNGARNWLEVAGYSLQPSELVKVAYIYVGASTLDRLYRRRNLYSYIAFSAACVIALALIGDFGTALIFFATFLVISFMRSGSHRHRYTRGHGGGACGLPRGERQAVHRPALCKLGACLGGHLQHRLPADPRDVRRRIRRALRQGRGQRLAAQCFCREHRHGFRHDMRGAGAHHRPLLHRRDTGSRLFRRAQRKPQPQRVLFHRRLRDSEHAARAAVAERFRLSGYPAVYRRDLPIRLPRRHVASLLLDAHGFHKRLRHAARGQLCGETSDRRIARRGGRGRRRIRRG